MTTLPAHDIQVVEALDGVRCLAVAAGGWHSLALMGMYYNLNTRFALCFVDCIAV